jgi:mRNA-degrading endonuclease RelE of RelBE toxin-antitoxin system
VSEELGRPRQSIVWSEEARSDLRAIDRQIALDILHCTDRYLSTRNGDVKKLRPPQMGFRLRCGDYRLFFELKNESTIQILGVRHRREAYR